MLIIKRNLKIMRFEAFMIYYNVGANISIFEFVTVLLFSSTNKYTAVVKNPGTLKFEPNNTEEKGRRQNVSGQESCSISTAITSTRMEAQTLEGRLDAGRVENDRS